MINMYYRSSTLVINFSLFIYCELTVCIIMLSVDPRLFLTLRFMNMSFNNGHFCWRYIERHIFNIGLQMGWGAHLNIWYFCHHWNADRRHYLANLSGLQNIATVLILAWLCLRNLFMTPRRGSHLI